MNEYTMAKLRALEQNVREMLDKMSSIRYVVHAKGMKDGCWYTDVVLDYIDDSSVPPNIEKQFKNLVPPDMRVTWDYYEICRDDYGEVALKTYLHDIDEIDIG